MQKYRVDLFFVNSGFSRLSSKIEPFCFAAFCYFLKEISEILTS